MTHPELPPLPRSPWAIALTIVLCALLISCGVAWFGVDNTRIRRHELNYLPSPAPSDHGWITPSQPTNP